MSTTAWRMTHIFPVGQRIITPDALGFIENICTQVSDLDFEVEFIV